jgi:hypothetical protein
MQKLCGFASSSAGCLFQCLQNASRKILLNVYAALAVGYFI